MFGILLLGSLITVGLGLKYLPFNKIISIPSAPVIESAGQQQTSGQTSTSFLYNFEVSPGKNIPGGIYKGLAHSGIYASKAFGKNSYGAAIEKTVEEIGKENFNSAGWSAWIYVFPTNREVKASLVFAVSNELGLNVCWKAVNLSGPWIPKGNWFKISTSSGLSDIVIKNNYKVHVYLWNDSNTNILADDIFVTFNASSQRNGDSTLVDMTRNIQFKSRFNFPPFRTVFLEKNEIFNQETSFLINDKAEQTGKINPDEKIMGGNFLNSTTGLDDILVVKKRGTPEIFTFCKEDERFKKIRVDITPDIMPYFTVRFVVKGKFIKNGYEQILACSEKGFILGQFDQINNICSPGSGLKTGFKTIWKSEILEIGNNTIPQDQIFYTGDFNGDQQTELLIIPGNGTWKLMSFVAGSGGKWRTIAEGSKTIATEWDSTEFEFNISVGQFLQGLKQDVLLTVAKNKQTGQKIYYLTRFNDTGLRFEPVFPDSQQNYGKTIGLDTLRLSDNFLTGHFDGKGAIGIFRYNRDWRFDLKQIRFNDTTFQIIQNIDFTGFLNDHNPKYYGVLSLIPGKFIDPGKTSLLVTGRNCKDIKFNGMDCKEYSDKSILPDFISIYSLEQQLKK